MYSWTMTEECLPIHRNAKAFLLTNLAKHVAGINQIRYNFVKIISIFLSLVFSRAVSSRFVPGAKYKMGPLAINFFYNKRGWEYFLEIILKSQHH